MTDALQKLAAFLKEECYCEPYESCCEPCAKREELSHLLLPVFEALYAITRESRKGMGAVQSADLIRGHKVLAQLEEALSGN